MPNRLYFFLSAALFLTTSTTRAEDTPAFPGAEGYGMFVTGGRGGSVYHVTSLADDGSQGTLRWALGQKGKKTIVFDVDGTIHLTSSLDAGSSVTIAGQTAPGDGVCIADYPFTLKGSNIILRYVRVRLGNNNVTVDGADGWDALGAMDTRDIIVDHCSVSWSIDECLSFVGCTNTTVQWCIVANSLVNAGHSKGSHGYGGNWGGTHASYHHNLMAHHESREPRLGPRPTTQLNERMDMRDNVFYNWGGNGCYGGEGMKVNIVNNYYKPGPATKKLSTVKQKRIAAIGVRTTEYITTYPAYAPAWHLWGKYYVSGNVNDTWQDVTNDNWTYGIYNQIDTDGNDGTYTSVTKDTIKLTEPIDFIHTTTHSARTAYEKVLSYAGASLHRDSYDEDIISNTANGTYTAQGSSCSIGMINSQNDLKPSGADSTWSAWPALASGDERADSDGDGIPDEWEDANGLDKNDADDGNSVNSEGYTNLEVYMNSLVSDITEGETEGGTVEGKESLEELGDVIAENAAKGGVVEYVLDKTACTSTSGDTEPYYFTSGGEDFSVSTNKGNKTLGFGGTYVKYSSGNIMTIKMPDGVSVDSISITGYGNSDTEDGAVSQINGDDVEGWTYTSRAEGIIDTHGMTFASPVTGTLTFKVANTQCCLGVTLVSSEETANVEKTAVSAASGGALYNLAGQRVTDSYKGTVIIRGKKKILLRQ